MTTQFILLTIVVNFISLYFLAKGIKAILQIISLVFMGSAAILSGYLVLNILVQPIVSTNYELPETELELAPQMPSNSDVEIVDHDVKPIYVNVSPSKINQEESNSLETKNTNDSKKRKFDYAVNKQNRGKDFVESLRDMD